MKHIIFLTVLVLIVALSFGILFIFTPSNSGNYASVYSDNKLIKSIDLSAVESPYEFTVDYKGHQNTVFVEKNKISVKDSDCPDKLCVNQGHGTYPIVCLPNKLLIEVSGSNENQPDAVSR